MMDSIIDLFDTAETAGEGNGACTRGNGKWAQPGVPHKGWSEIGTEDLGPGEGNRRTCEMCETMHIRHVHYMIHPHYPETLGCGWICADHMEKGYADGGDGARQRENAFKNRQRGVMARFYKRWDGPWKMGPDRKSLFIDTVDFHVKDFHVEIFFTDDLRFSFKIEDRRTGECRSSDSSFSSIMDAKEGALREMEIMW